MTRTRPARAETRRKVLDAAYLVFGERGIVNTSLEEVAAAAGLTKGAVYSNFRSKDEMVLTLMEERAAGRVAKSLQAARGAKTPAQVAEHIGGVLVHEMRADPIWRRLLVEYAAMARRDPDIADRLRRSRREMRAMLTEVLVSLADTFEVRLPMPAADLAIVLLAVSNGLALETDMEPEGVRDDLFAQVLSTLAGEAVTTVVGARLPAPVDG